MTNSITASLHTHSEQTSQPAADQVVNISKLAVIPSYSGIYTSDMVRAESPNAPSSYIATALHELNTIDLVCFAGNYEALAAFYDLMVLGLVTSIVEGKLSADEAGKQARYISTMFGECLHDVRDTRNGVGLDIMVQLAAEIVTRTKATTRQAIQRAAEIVQDYASE